VGVVPPGRLTIRRENRRAHNGDCLYYGKLILRRCFGGCGSRNGADGTRSNEGVKENQDVRVVDLRRSSKNTRKLSDNRRDSMVMVKMSIRESVGQLENDT